MCARTCDSKNLNMSPLCDLQSGLEPSLWQGEVVNTYEAAAGDKLQVALIFAIVLVIL